MTTVRETTTCCAPLTCAPLTAGDATLLAPLFKALGDPVRLRLMSLIACHDDGEVCVCDLTGAFELSPATISHHLKVLREAGLIEAERRGTWIYYRAEPHALAKIAGLVGSPEAGVPAAGMMVDDQAR